MGFLRKASSAGACEARTTVGDNSMDGSNTVNNLNTMSLNAELSRIATTRDHAPP